MIKINYINKLNILIIASLLLLNSNSNSAAANLAQDELQEITNISNNLAAVEPIVQQPRIDDNTQVSQEDQSEVEEEKKQNEIEIDRQPSHEDYFPKPEEESLKIPEAVASAEINEEEFDNKKGLTHFMGNMPSIMPAMIKIKDLLSSGTKKAEDITKSSYNYLKDLFGPDIENLIFSKDKELYNYTDAEQQELYRESQKRLKNFENLYEAIKFNFNSGSIRAKVYLDKLEILNLKLSNFKTRFFEYMSEFIKIKKDQNQNQQNDRRKNIMKYDIISTDNEIKALVYLIESLESKLNGQIYKFRNL